MRYRVIIKRTNGTAADLAERGEKIYEHIVDDIDLLAVTKAVLKRPRKSRAKTQADSQTKGLPV